MQETILAGQDGKTPAVDAASGKPLTIEELLRRRGILALDNVPSMFHPDAASSPVVSDAANAPSSATAAAALAGANGATANAPGGSAVGSTTSATPNADGVDPRVTPVAKAPEQMTDGDISGLAQDLVAAGAGAAGALLLKYLATRKSNPMTPPPDISTDPAAASPEAQRVLNDHGYVARPIEDGVFHPVYDNQVSSTERKSLPAPTHDSVAKALANRNGAPDPSYSVKKGGTVAGRPVSGELQDMNTRAPVATRQQVGARAAVQSRVLPSGQGVIQSGDAMSDIPPDILAQINSTAQQLAARRLQGRNAVRAGNGVARGIRSGAAPSAPVEPTAITNELVRLYRANPNIARIISRIP